MSEAVILRWLQAIDRRLDGISGELAQVQQSLAGFRAERGSGLRRRATATKVVAGAIVAAASALAGRYLGQ